MKAIADTGFLVAFLSERDRHHAWAVELAESVAAPLITCDAVIAETIFHVGHAAIVLALLEERFVRSDFSVHDHLHRLRELAARYADRNPDFADLCLIKLSELHPKLPVLTTDVTDFRVYRRGRREMIPILHPRL